MFRIYRVLVVVVAAFALLVTGMPGDTSAGYVKIIDNFNEPTNDEGDLFPYVLADSFEEILTSTQSGLNVENVIGGVRAVELEVDGADGSANLIAPGRLAFALDPQTSGTLVLTYANGDGGLNADLTAGGARFFVIDVFSIDLPERATFDIGVENGGGPQKSGPISITGPGKVFVPFSSFNGFNFEDVSKITLTIIAADAIDLKLDSFYTAVPEPSTLATFGIGLVALYGVARFRKRRKKSKG